MTDREKLLELLLEAEKHSFVMASQSQEEQIHGLMALFADHLLANGVTFAKDMDVPGKWISVEDRLPEEEQIVLLLCKNGARFVGYCKYYTYEPEPRWRIKTALNSTKLLNKGRVTHWMPLPELPEEEQK